MPYISTRGKAAPVSFADVLFSGPTDDGGLFVPEAWPRIDAETLARLAGASYQDVAFDILARFAGDAFAHEELRADIDSAYAAFDVPAVAPLSQIAPELYLLELFHGPTLAFKDIALQLLGRLFARGLKKRGTRATVVAATSGDTGSAAIAAFGGLPDIEIFILHPLGRVSEVQRRQMTTARHDNVHNIALEGSFDDAQAIVKGLFADHAFARAAHLSAVNSINFVRIAVQSVYYFTAAAKFGAAPVFVVPTGNFGDVFAGEAAMRMGLPVVRLAVATNANDILARALNTGVYAPGEPQATLSPSMDIQVASNFERALFEASGRDSEWLNAAMTGFVHERRLVLPAAVLDALRARYLAHRCDDVETIETIARVHRQIGRLIDPHTAVGVAVASKLSLDANVKIVLATAHPAKFPDAVLRATGLAPPLPPRLAGLYEEEERVTVLPNEGLSVRAFIEDRLSYS